MQLFIYPEKDATIYDDLPTNNFGKDEILEIVKTSNRYYNFGSNYFCKSRILLKFDLQQINNLLASYTSIIPEYYLTLNICRIFGQYENSNILYLYPIESTSEWGEGTGKRLSSNNKYDGVSWSKKNINENWINNGGDYNINKLLYNNLWNNNFENITNFKINVTNIVNDWINNYYNNYGFLIKRSDGEESDNIDYGVIQFYSKDTNTILSPKLEMHFDDSQYTYTGSFTNFDINNIFISVINLKPQYYYNETATINLRVRKLFSTKTSTNIFPFNETLILPPTTYYSIVDALTLQEIIPFNDFSTKISYINGQHFFKINMNNFAVNRFYKIKIKIKYNNQTSIFDIPETFKVIN